MCEVVFFLSFFFHNKLLLQAEWMMLNYFGIC